MCTGDLLAFAALACGSGALPAPRAAADELSVAVRRKDARAVHAMLDAASRSRVTVDEVRVLIERDGTEITRRLDGGGKEPVELRADAVMPGGERLTLTSDGEGFRVSETSALLGFAVTPEEALMGLRRALELPDYTLLLQLLTDEVREQVESRRRALVEALAELRALDVATQGDRAIITTADGHRVELELESGVWRVRDFE